MKTRNVRPHTRRYRLGNLDRRTSESKLLEQFRDELIIHCGGEPSIVQRTIIERAAWLRLRLALLDGKIATGAFSEPDSRCYLGWANTLSRLLLRLGVSPTAAPQPSLSEVLGDIAARRSQPQAVEDGEAAE